jgi:hypothetical protein
MRYRKLGLLSTLTLGAAVAVFVATASGAVAQSESGQSAARFAKIDPSLIASDGAAG